MTIDSKISSALQNLRKANDLLTHELRTYPTPISGCDAQYNYLIGRRSAVSDAIRLLEEERFVATPRKLNENDGIEIR
ncbi:MAG: hypothetical protein OXC68_00505 [Aestuariivita sp.]|nr:hypothetical protein [Aestuariivita sp.]